MKIACLAITYKRPVQLANALACYLAQDYPADQRELIILDDAGQYDNQEGDGWRLVSIPRRFRTLGEKRNASVALASADVDAYCVWDDDDAYLPWHVSACAAALADADYTIPTALYLEKPGPRLTIKPNTYLFHGGWSFRRSAFEQAGGYPFIQSGQDQGLLRRLKAAKLRRADPIQHDPRPSYIYRWFTNRGAYHISAMGQHGYQQLVERPGEYVGQLVPRFEHDWVRLHRELAS